MAIQGMNLPSIAGVLGFKDFTNQLNNANAGVRNAVGLVNDWAKIAAQNNQAEKAAQAQRDFTAEQNQLNRDFQQAQQDERFEHELGMWNKQQEKLDKENGMKARIGLKEVATTPVSDKFDTNAMTQQKILNKINEIKEHPSWYGNEEEVGIINKGLQDKLDELVKKNEDISRSNELTNDFNDFVKGDFRNKQTMIDWFMENQDDIDRLHPQMRRKVEEAIERKTKEEAKDDMQWQMLQNSMLNSKLGVKSAIRKDKEEEAKSNSLLKF
jgi:hypothetical protein